MKKLHYIYLRRSPAAGITEELSVLLLAKPDGSEGYTATFVTDGDIENELSECPAPEVARANQLYTEKQTPIAKVFDDSGDEHIFILRQSGDEEIDRMYVPKETSPIKSLVQRYNPQTDTATIAYTSISSERISFDGMTQAVLRKVYEHNFTKKPFFFQARYTGFGFTIYADRTLSLIRALLPNALNFEFEESQLLIQFETNTALSAAERLIAPSASGADPSLHTSATQGDGIWRLTVTAETFCSLMSKALEADERNPQANNRYRFLPGGAGAGAAAEPADEPENKCVII